jgi:hypothetical protein
MSAYPLPSGMTVLSTKVLTFTKTFIYVSRVETITYNTLYGDITVVYISTYTHIETLATRSIHLHFTHTLR